MILSLILRLRAVPVFVWWVGALIVGVSVLLLWWVIEASPSDRLVRAWTAIACIGLVFTVWMIVDVWLDYRSVVRGIDEGYARAGGGRWWSAVGGVVVNVLTVFVWAGFCLVGFLSLFKLGAGVAGWILIGMEAMLVGIQIWLRFVRRRITGRPRPPQAGRVSPPRVSS